MPPGTLKTCPFCGAQPVIQKWHGGGPRKRLICCDNVECHASPSVSGSTEARAVERWNARA